MPGVGSIRGTDGRSARSKSSHRIRAAVISAGPRKSDGAGRECHPHIQANRADALSLTAEAPTVQVHLKLLVTDYREPAGHG
jgi:hypothetical protein